MDKRQYSAEEVSGKSILICHMPLSMRLRDLFRQPLNVLESARISSVLESKFCFQIFANELTS